MKNKLKKKQFKVPGIIEDVILTRKQVFTCVSNQF